MIKNAALLTSATERFIETTAKLCFTTGKDPLFALRRVHEAKENIKGRVIRSSPRGFDISELFGGATFVEKLEEAGKIDFADRLSATKEFLSDDKDQFFKKLKEAIICLSKIDKSFLELQADIDKKIEPEPQKEEVIENVTFSEPAKVEEKEEQPETKEYPQSGGDPNAWYVSAEREPKKFFLNGSEFYGPFEDQISATVFSFLIHDSRFFEDRSIAIGGKLLSSRNTDLQAAKNIESATVKNTSFAALILNLSLEITEGKVQLKVATSGQVFEALKQFITENMPGANRGIALAEIDMWLSDGGFNTFPSYFFEETKTIPAYNAPKSFDIVDIGIPGEDSGKDKPVKTVPKPLELESAKSDTKNSSDDISGALPIVNNDSLKITSDDNSEKLSDKLITAYIDQLRATSASLSSITDSTIKDSIDSCISSLNSFFKDLFEKDASFKRQIIKFRQDNPLNVAPVTPLWEFRNNFSLLNRIISDPIISKNISHFVSKIVFYKALFRPSRFNAGTIYGLEKTIMDRSKKYQIAKGLATHTDQQLLEDATSKITALISKELERISGKVIAKVLELFLSGNGSLDTDKFIERIILDINMNWLINKYVAEFFSSKEKIIEVDEIVITKCGVCDQSFSVPKEYKENILKFSKAMDQYSFFRSDGSIISEDELIGDPQNPKKYNISDEIFNIITDRRSRMAASQFIRRTKSGEDKVKAAVRKVYSWEEINKMMSGSSKVEDQIDGLIIRNEILKDMGGTVSGDRGMFANKTLCASTLYGLSPDVKRSHKSYIEDEDNFECRGSIMASFEKVPGAKSYQESSYTMPYGNIKQDDSVKKNSGFGFRFSRNIAYCPCHIDSASPLIADVVDKKKYGSIIKIIAIPNLPQDVISQISGLEKFNKEDLSLLNSPPTNPDGTLSNINSAGYIVCGRKVSISMFDRDPSSPNYIQKFFRKLLVGGDSSALIRAVKVLINYGMEMNDIKPHVEAVMSNSELTSTSKMRLLQLFKKAVDVSEIAESDSDTVRGLGLICEHGHKFTLGQSLEFSRTHYSIDLASRGEIPVPIKNTSAILKSNDDAMASLIDIGVFKTRIDEAIIQRDGYKQASQAKDYNELKQLISERLLYFKSNDGSVYTIGTPMFGKFKQNPWSTSVINRQDQATHKFYTHQTGGTSLQTKNEEGDTVELSIGDQNAASADDITSQIDEMRSTKQNIDLSFASLVFPDIDQKTTLSISENVYSFAQLQEQKLGTLSKKFVEHLTKTLTLSRVWGSMAADSQLDFLNGIGGTAKYDASGLDLLKKNILNTLRGMSNSVGLEPEDYADDFFSNYDIDHLITNEISGQKFLSLATIAQYYSGFTVPFVANLNAADARSSIIFSLSSAISNTLPKILSRKLGSDVSEKINKLVFKQICDSVAALLISPYDKIFSSASSYKTLVEKAVVDYTGRAIIFSFATEIVSKLNNFFSQYFFNEDSPLYIGPYPGSDYSALNILDELMSTRSYNDTNIATLLMLDNTEFEEKIGSLKDSLLKIYDNKSLFDVYMRHKNISASSEQRQFYAQKSVVYSRFCKLFEIAINSIDIINADVLQKPVGSESIRRSAKSLDDVIVSLAKNRDPQNFERIASQMEAAKVGIGQNAFERNASAYARISLNASNESLAPITYIESSIVSIPLKREALTSEYFELKSIGGNTIDLPNLFGLKKITIAGNAFGGNIFYLALIPLKIEHIEAKISGKFELKDYLAFDGINVIRLDNVQGGEFAARYLGGLAVDTSRLVLINEELVSRNISTRGLKDPVIDNLVDKNRDMTIRIGKVDDPPLFWPPPNNLIYNGYDIARDVEGDKAKNIAFVPQSNSQTAAKVEAVDKYYSELFGANHADFIKNIEVFKDSLSSRSMDVSSSHGLIIPLKEDGGRIADITRVTNTIAQDEVKDERTFFSLSRGTIFADVNFGIDDMALQSGLPDLSWAFKLLDPQFINSTGDVRHKLVQSGIVQKMDYISSKMNEIYLWAIKNAKPVMKELFSDNIPSNYPSFANSLFSIHNRAVTLSVDIQKGVSTARLNSDDEIFERMKLIAPNIYDDFMARLYQLMDYYNCAQILNAKYAELPPSLCVSRAFDLASQAETKALSLKLLDPYSLWMIVNNPAMTQQFGGPIDPSLVGYYKSFIINTFGIDEIRSKICLETGISAKHFGNEDMFNLPAFCEKYISEFGETKEMAKFIKLFGLTYNSEIGTINKYSNGYPIGIGKNKFIADIIRTSGTSDVPIHPSSYVEHIYRTEDAMSQLTAVQRKDIETVRKLGERDVLLQSGADSHTLKEIIAFGKKTIREDYASLAREARYILAKLYAGQTTKVSNLISARKIAQSESDDGGTIVRTMYHEWWERYLKMMAKMAS